MRIGRVSCGSSISTLCIELIFIIWPFDAMLHWVLSVTAPSRQVKAANRADRRHHGGRPFACGTGLGQSWPRAIKAGNIMLLVTGGAGFIRSNVVAARNDAGHADVAVCDLLGHDGKWRNLAKRRLGDHVPAGQFPECPDG